MAIARFKDLCIDAADRESMAHFWADLLGLRRASEASDGPVELVGDKAAQTVWINAVPEAKTVKNRVHWDIETALGTDALVAHGAQVLRLPDSDIEWTIMADPEGNEFCVFSSEPTAS